MIKRFSVFLSGNQIVLLFSLYAAVVLNIGYWQSVLSLASQDWVLLLSMPFFIVAALNFIMQLLFWPKIHRVIIPLLLVLGSAAAYAVMTQKIYFNADQINNILQTDQLEASSWISFKFVIWVMLTGIVPALWYVWCVSVKKIGFYREALWKSISMLVSVGVVVAIAALAYQNYASFFRNNKGINYQIVPVNFIGSAVKLAYNAYDDARPFEKIGEDAKRLQIQGARKKVLVLVIGETTRAQNWGLNAHAPETTPQLAKINDVINYPDVHSCGTATNISLPCMFSHLTRENYSAGVAKHQENLLDIVQRAGIYTSWRENDGGSKGVANRIKFVEMSKILGENDKRCKENLCYDAALLEGLKEEIKAMPSDGVIVLHTNGSHGPTYFERYPERLKKFSPTCDTNQIQDCSAEQLGNTYNNTIVAIDDMLAQTITLLQDETSVDGALWYLSDHGESLGENGLYLHATPYAIAPSQQTHIPMIFWATKGFYQTQHLNEACLKQNSTHFYSHDNLFHSVLGVMNVGTKEYQRSMDLFASCRG